VKVYSQSFKQKGNTLTYSVFYLRQNCVKWDRRLSSGSWFYSAP